MKKSEKNIQASKKKTPFTYEINHNSIQFSVREAQCANYFKDKHSIEEIARRLNVTSKTVEFYLNNMKTKLGCYDKQQLIEFLRNFELGEEKE